MVIMNAATSIITTKSPYMVRTSLTVPQVDGSARHVGLQERTCKKAYTMVSRLSAPAIDAEAGFQRALQGGRRRDRRLGAHPVANPDFSAFVQRAKDLNPEAIFIFVPGRRAAGGDRQGARRARHRHRRRPRSSGRAKLADDSALKSMGDAALGIITGFHYDYNHKSAMNKKFVADYKHDIQRATRISSRSAAMTACT